MESNKYNFDKDFNSDDNFYSQKICNQCSYYTDDEFNEKMNQSKSEHLQLSIVHLNCRSLVAHINDIRNYLNKLTVKFDVIALSETWLVPQPLNLSDFHLNGYIMYSMPRKNKNGGGVAMYVKDDLHSNEITKISKGLDNCMESIFINVNLNNKEKVTIGSIFTELQILTLTYLMMR